MNVTDLNPDTQRPVFVFDSGMGGITVLKELAKQMPNEHFLFFGDSANAPYGTKSREEVYKLTRNGVLYALSRQAKAVVIACNTATSAAAADLRLEFPELPIIGLEPAVKPAVLYPYPFLHERKPRILCMATELTLTSEKFLSLASLYQDQAEIFSLPSPHLVPLIEAGEIGTEPMRSYLNDILAPYQDKKIDGVVLGCTHFPFAKECIGEVLGYPVLFFDGAEGAAREMKRRLMVNQLSAPAEAMGSISFENSAPGISHIHLEKALFHRDIR